MFVLPPLAKLAPRAIFCALLGVLASTLHAQSTASDAVLTALRSEVTRSMKGLAQQTPAPYMISYGVTETSSTLILASFGNVLSNTTTEQRVLDVDLRVGDYALDNTRSIRGVAFELGRGTRGVQLPLGNDVDALRAAVWRATDQAYRSAAERYEKVITNLKVKVREEDSSADLSREIPSTFIQQPVQAHFDTLLWRQRVVELSSIFRGYPEIYTGRVSFQSDVVTKTIVTSEGTTVRLVEPIIKLFIYVKTKADDGMSLPVYESYSAYTADRLPSMEQLRADAQRLLEVCRQLRTAPLMETYSGPAILSGRSAGVFFHEIFGHRVEGHRQKDANSSQTFKNFIGQRILPPFIDVVFDPTMRSLNGIDVVGSYQYDDEGMPAQRVQAVDQGIFKNFLMSRSPIENFPSSNGHGRRQAGNKAVSRQSNLLVIARESVPVADLRSALRQECQRQGKEFGLYFEDIQGGFTFTGRTVPNAFNVQPLIVYKVFADGRPDELVRGVDLIGTPLTTFTNITMAGNDVGIFNGVCGAESGGVPVSASSPSLLVSQIEVQKKQKSQAKPPILPDPTSVAGSTPNGASSTTDMMIRAMQDEIARSISDLRIDDLPAPYYVEYILNERDRIGVHATLGSVEDTDTTSMTTLTVRVRVGDPSFDNTNFFDVSLGFFGSSDDEESFRNRLIPRDLSYSELRRELWLATDACYKQAVEIYAKKTASVKNRTRADTTWDFAMLPPEILTDTTGGNQASVSSDHLVQMAKDIATAVSAEFRNHPEIHASRVAMEFVPERTVYVNSEGRVMVKSESFSGLEIIAATQAADGQPISDAWAAYGARPANLPTMDSLRTLVGNLCATVIAQQHADKIEPYSGPVLLEGQAAAQFIAQEFAPMLVAQRKPLSEGGFSTDERSMAFQNKIGARVLPEFLSVHARPSLTTWDNSPVAGTTILDDEGIPSQDVALVENGYLRTLLSSRVPTRRIKQSNGHQRGGAAMVSVLQCSATDTSHQASTTELRAQLLELVAQRELPYGVVIRRILDRNLLATGVYPLLAGSATIRLQPGSVLILEAVRLYPDGHEEPIRGAELAGLSTYTFKDIVKVGSAEHVHNYLAPAVVPAFITGGSQYVISTVIAPDLLVDDAEVRQPDGDLPTLPVLTHPLAD